MKEKNENRIMAIDYGEKRVGIALTDPLKIIAYPFSTIANDKNLFDNIFKIINENSVSQIVLGYPLKENGEKTNVTLLVENFKNKLEEKINIDITYVDERYSSVIALDRIRESVTSRKKRRNKSLIDSNAAAVILEEYLKENQ